MRNSFLIGVLVAQICWSFLLYGQYSQTESYLKALAPTRGQAYDKIKKALKAPPADDINNPNPSVGVNPKDFEPLINQAIETEKNHPNYYVLYHGSQKEGILLSLLRTYLSQQEQGWTRDDFFILRQPEFFYQGQAATAQDFIKQNIPTILQQYRDPSGGKNDCVEPRKVGCYQFDFTNPYRDYLISTSPAFIAGVDPASIELRRMAERDWAAWESSFYYFATNLSWSNVRRLYNFLVSDLKKLYPALFEDSAINDAVRKYVAIKFSTVVGLLFPHAAQQLEAQQKVYANAGMMFQIFIPKDLIDKVAYLAWDNGIVWQRTINGIMNGWNNEVGVYTQLGPILDILQKNPEQLGASINSLQTRIILKDKQYFYDPSSPIKINLVHTEPKSLFRSIQDLLKTIARVVVENNKAKKSGTQQQWFEQSNIAVEVQRQEDALKKLLASSEIRQQIEGLNILYYFGKIGIEKQWARNEAAKYQGSSNPELKAISNDILQNVN